MYPFIKKIKNKKCPCTLCGSRSLCLGNCAVRKKKCVSNKLLPRSQIPDNLDWWRPRVSWSSRISSRADKFAHRGGPQTLRSVVTEYSCLRGFRQTNVWFWWWLHVEGSVKLLQIQWFRGGKKKIIKRLFLYLVYSP